MWAELGETVNTDWEHPGGAGVDFSCLFQTKMQFHMVENELMGGTAPTTHC